MKRLVLPTLLLVSASLVAACEQPGLPTAATPLDPQFAKKPDGGGGSGGVTSECGGSTTYLDSRAILDWGTTGAIQNDEFGPYHGSQDGVHAKIFYYDASCSRSGDLVFDANMQQRNGPRRLAFVFPEGNPAGVPAGTYHDTPFVNFRQLMQLGSDAYVIGTADARDSLIEAKSPGSPRGMEYPSSTADRPDYPVTINGAAPPFEIGTSVPGCETLRYASITLTRTVGQSGFVAVGGQSQDGLLPLARWNHEVAGQWVVSGETAQCVRSLKGGRTEVNGAPFAMPFAVTVTEVLQ